MLSLQFEIICSMAKEKFIEAAGVKVNNLKNVDVTIPRNKFVVIIQEYIVWILPKSWTIVRRIKLR